MAWIAPAARPGMSARHPVSVLHLIGSARPEATSIVTIVKAVAELADPERYRMTAWFVGEDGPLRAELSAAGLEARYVPFGGRRDGRGAVRLQRELTQGRFPIVHRHTGGRSLGVLLRTCPRSRLITHIHGFNEATEALPARLRFPLSDRIILTSAWLGAVAASVPTSVIYPGIDVSLARPSSPSGRPLIIGAAGRLVPMKGFRHLVAAFDLVRREVDAVTLEIAGEGPERPLLEADIRRLGLHGHVRLLGWRPTPPISPAWTVFVQPSVTEPFGMSALEAMATGLPVIASRVGGLRELILDEVTGYLVPASDPNALSEALVALLQSSQRRTELGQAGWLRARTSFSREHMVARIIRVYDEVLRDGTTQTAAQ